MPLKLALALRQQRTEKRPCLLFSPSFFPGPVLLSISSHIIPAPYHEKCYNIENKIVHHLSMSAILNSAVRFACKVSFSGLPAKWREGGGGGGCFLKYIGGGCF